MAIEGVKHPAMSAPNSKAFSASSSESEDTTSEEPDGDGCEHDNSEDWFGLAWRGIPVEEVRARASSRAAVFRCAWFKGAFVRVRGTAVLFYAAFHHE